MQFELNGQPVEIPAMMEDDRLLWVLRDYFTLNGPKFGCGVGACGACVIHIDGVAERACALTAKYVERRSVVTLEGLGASYPDGLHPVQRSWLDHLVPQCGYCQNGQIMTAAALLSAKPGAGQKEISEAMDNVICRCGTYSRIRSAIAQAQLQIKSNT